jgi:hypothetical protein
MRLVAQFPRYPLGECWLGAGHVQPEVAKETVDHLDLS